jgi:hypothetical protein
MLGLSLLSRYDVFRCVSIILLKVEVASNSEDSCLLLFLKMLFLRPRDDSVANLKSFFNGIGIGLAPSESYEFLIEFLYVCFGSITVFVNLDLRVTLLISEESIELPAC